MTNKDFDHIKDELLKEHLIKFYNSVVQNYIQHTCPNCGEAFLGEDILKRKSLQEWRYCPECESKGFISELVIFTNKNNLKKNKDDN
jgi:predicted RNA-binding Zn-ribbon protein involved in translation (DUF1610 family)